MNKTILVTFAIVGLLQGCSTISDAPASNWVDVPLSANTYWDASIDFKEAEYQVALAPGESLEHMLTINESDVVTYHWSVPMADPSKLTAEFHGHTVREGDAPGKVMFYKVHQGASESGSLRAPFDGIHGWYFNNESDEAIVITLKVSGFFEDS